DKARRRLEGAGLANGEFRAGDACALAVLAPWRADLVFLANVFHGVLDRPRLAGAVAAVLKPGGRFAIVNWHARPREETVVLGEPRGPKTALRMSPEQTIRDVTAAGLRHVGLIEIP